MSFKNTNFHNIITDYSVPRRRFHYLLIASGNEKINGFKHEFAFLQSLGARLRGAKQQVSMVTKKKITRSDIVKHFDQDNTQLIVLFSGHGGGGRISLSTKESFDIAEFPEDTILFTSSCDPFARANRQETRQKNITVIGEKSGIRYNERSKTLEGVFSDLMSEKDHVCYQVR